MKRTKMKMENHNVEVTRCPVCGASAVDACKKPELKKTNDCPRTK